MPAVTDPAATLGETDEADRIAQFLKDSDPDLPSPLPT